MGNSGAGVIASETAVLNNSHENQQAVFLVLNVVSWSCGAGEAQCLDPLHTELGSPLPHSLVHVFKWRRFALIERKWLVWVSVVRC
jgi:hypothetical protein